MALPTSLRSIQINGNAYTIARSDNGNPQWQVTREPAEPDELIPFREHISFGYGGMGSSLTAAPWQYDYALDVDVDAVWDELHPGLLQGKVGLALDYQVVTLDDAVAAAPSQSLVSPSNSVNNTSAGTVAWSNPGNATADDATFTTAALTNGATSQYLTTTNFNGGLAVPTNATVLGIYAHIEASINTGSVTLNGRLVLDGTIQSTVRSTLIDSAAAGVVYVLGGAADLWGEDAITSTQANKTGANFGVALSATGTATQTLSVDHVRLTVVYGTPHKLLYAGAGPVLTKLTYTVANATPAFATIQSKTFNHQSFVNTNAGGGGSGGFGIIFGPLPPSGGSGGSTSNPAGSGGFGITDVIVTKGGNASGDGHLLVAFGGAAALQQVDSISGYGDDTYKAGANSAFASHFTTALANDNSATTVWKSTAAVNQSGGVFCRLQARALSTGTLDLTDETNWAPDDTDGVAYQVGDKVHGISGMTEYQRGLVVAKPEGVYFFDQNANSYAALSTAEFPHQINGRNLLVWNNTLIAPTSEDIVDVTKGGDPYIGITQLLANLSPVKGTPTALAAYGRTLYVSYYDGTDSYIVAMRRRGQEPVPQDLIIHPLTKVATHQVSVMKVCADATGSVFLFYDCPSDTANKFDIGYCVLAPVAQRRYQTGGQWYSQRAGSAEKKTYIERLVFYSRGTNANNYWDVQVSWDEAAFANFGAVSRINSTGRTTLTPTYGTNDSGYQFQLKLVSTLNNSISSYPVLRALTAGGSENGGVIVEGQRQADMVDRFQVVILLSNNQETGIGGDLAGTARTRFEALANVAGTRTQMVNELHWGNTTARNVFIQSVQYAAGPQESRKEGERVAIVTGRLLVGTE